MKKLLLMLVVCAFVLIPATLFASPTVYPMGTTIYKPEKCWNGYTVLSNHFDTNVTKFGTPLIDMNGNEVHRWMNVCTFPGKILPEGRLLLQFSHPGFLLDQPLSLKLYNPIPPELLDYPGPGFGISPHRYRQRTQGLPGLVSYLLLGIVSQFHKFEYRPHIRLQLQRVYCA